MDHMRFNASYKAMQVCVVGSKPAAACSHLSTAALPCQQGCLMPLHCLLTNQDGAQQQLAQPFWFSLT